MLRITREPSCGCQAILPPFFSLLRLRVIGWLQAWESPVKDAEQEAVRGAPESLASACTSPQKSDSFGMNLTIDTASVVAAAGAAPESGKPFKSLQNLLHAIWQQGGGLTAQEQHGESVQVVPVAGSGSWGPAADSRAPPPSGENNSQLSGGNSADSGASSSSESGHITWPQAAPVIIGSVLGSALSSCGTSRPAQGSQHSDRSPGWHDAAASSRGDSVRSTSISSSVDAAWRVSLLEESLEAAVAAAVAEAEERASRRHAEQVCGSYVRVRRSGSGGVLLPNDVEYSVSVLEAKPLLQGALLCMGHKLTVGTTFVRVREKNGGKSPVRRLLRTWGAKQ